MQSRRVTPVVLAAAAMALVALVAVARGVAAQETPRPPRRGAVPAPGAPAYLRDRLGFSEREVQQVERGAIVTRVLTGASAEEVALVGVARLPVSPSEFARRFRALGAEARGPDVTQFGTFSRPPSPGDLARYTLPDGDLDALRACTVGACKLKLPGDAITGLGALGKSASADSVREFMRAWLLEYASGYVAGGNAALVVYDDARRPLALHEGFHALLAESPYLAEYLPEFHHYLDEFPARPLAGVEDRLYWSVEEFGLRPLTTITHAAIYARAAARAPSVLIALKQVYASHYFHARLSMLMLSATPDGAPGGAPASYLVWLDRSLFDTDLGGFTRRRVVGRLGENLKARLEALQRASRAAP